MEILCEKLRHSGDRKVAIDVLWFLTPEQLKEIFPTLIFLAGLIAYAETAQKLIRSIGLPWVSEHTEAEVYRCLEDDPADEQAYRLYLELYIYLRMTSSALKLLEHLRTSERLDLEEVYADYKERIYALLG